MVERTKRVLEAGCCAVMVQNEQMCLKLAFDVYVASSFPAYIASWLQVASKVTKAHNVQDYMAVNDVLAYAFCE